MQLNELHIQNFRCFTDYRITFASGLTVLSIRASLEEFIDIDSGEAFFSSPGRDLPRAPHADKKETAARTAAVNRYIFLPVIRKQELILQGNGLIYRLFRHKAFLSLRKVCRR